MGTPLTGTSKLLTHLVLRSRFFNRASLGLLAPSLSQFATFWTATMCVTADGVTWTRNLTAGPGGIREC